LLAISRDEVTLPEAARATIPYWSILILAIVILTAFPEIALYLTKFI